MRSYSVGEDCLILESALMVGMHRKHGFKCGASQKAYELSCTYRSLCKARGLSYDRTEGSLKMRVQRLLDYAVLKWGPPGERSKVFWKNRGGLSNAGTDDQRAFRTQLLGQMFSREDGTYYAVTKSKGKRKYTRRAPVGAAKPQQGSDMKLRNSGQGGSTTQQAVSRPREGNLKVSLSNCTEPSDEGTLHRKTDSCVTSDLKKEKVTEIQSAYKENLKTFRDLVGMQHEALKFIRTECEKHRDFLTRSLDDVSQQQQRLLQIMEKDGV